MVCTVRPPSASGRLPLRPRAHQRRRARKEEASSEEACPIPYDPIVLTLTLALTLALTLTLTLTVQVGLAEFAEAWAAMRRSAAYAGAAGGEVISAHGGAYVYTCAYAPYI